MEYYIKAGKLYDWNHKGTTDEQSLFIRQFETPEGTKAELMEDVYYVITTATQKIHLYIHKGFIYDGASIPKVLWGLIGSPFTGKYRLGSLVHDGLYATQYFSKKFTEDIFFNIMRVDGVAPWRRNLIYSGVLVGGFSAWNSHTPNITQNRKFVEVEIEDINS